MRSRVSVNGSCASPPPLSPWRPTSVRLALSHVNTIVPRKCSGSFCFSRALARASSTTGSIVGPAISAFFTPASTSAKLCRSSFRSMTCREEDSAPRGLRVRTHPTNLLCWAGGRRTSCLRREGCSERSSPVVVRVGSAQAVSKLSLSWFRLSIATVPESNTCVCAPC